MHDSSMGMPSRTLRYSDSERPACRMNHTGVCGTGSRLHALRKALSYVAVGCLPVGLPLALTTASLPRARSRHGPGLYAALRWCLSLRGAPLPLNVPRMAAAQGRLSD